MITLNTGTSTYLLVVFTHKTQHAVRKLVCDGQRLRHQIDMARRLTDTDIDRHGHEQVHRHRQSKDRLDFVEMHNFVDIHILVHVHHLAAKMRTQK